MPTGQVMQVRGYADQQLRKPDSPEDPSNRRIAVIVQYTSNRAENTKNDASEGEKRSNPPKGTQAQKSDEAANPAEH